MEVLVSNPPTENKPSFSFSIYPSHKAPCVIFVKVNAGLLTLLDAATKVMQEEMIKNVSNIKKYQPFSLLHDQFVLRNL